MPNWISGCLKVRGKFENVKRFFENGVDKAVVDGGGEGDGYIDVNIQEGSSGYVDGTRRAFLSVKHNMYLSEPDDGNEVVVAAFPIEQAWDFVKENWMAVSQKYNVDIRLYGIEMGMQFIHELEVVAGAVTLDSIREYHSCNAWNWECPFPYMGG